MEDGGKSQHLYYAEIDEEDKTSEGGGNAHEGEVIYKVNCLFSTMDRLIGVVKRQLSLSLIKSVLRENYSTERFRTQPSFLKPGASAFSWFDPARLTSYFSVRWFRQFSS